MAEVGTATKMAAKGAIEPVQEVMRERGEQFDANAYIPAVAGYYRSSKGVMLSLPFNSSTTVFYYNKDAFEKAGLDAGKQPVTWAEVGASAAKLKQSGMTCSYTTGWQSWVQLENCSAWHNLPFATKNNGFDGLGARLIFNGPLQVRHIGTLKDWMDKGYFSYGGRKNEPEAKFFSGECAMLTSSSAAYGNISKNAKFKFGVAPLPYYGAPQNTIIGGASLWVMSGKSKETYRGVAKFFTHLSSPEVRAEWHQGTGYLPITNAAYDLTKSSGFYDKNPALTVRTSGRNRPAPDAKLGVTFPADKLHRFDRASGQRIGPAPSAANADRSADVRSHE